MCHNTQRTLPTVHRRSLALGCSLRPIKAKVAVRHKLRMIKTILQLIFVNEQATSPHNERNRRRSMSRGEGDADAVQVEVEVESID